MAIVGDAFAKPMVRALEEAEAKGEPYDISSLAAHHQLRRDVVDRDQAGAHGRGNIICYDSLGSSEGVGFAGSINAPGSEPKTAKFTIGDDTKVFTDDGREVEPGSDEVGMLAVGGHIPVGYYKDERKSEATFREINGDALVGAGRLRARRGRRLDRAARPRARRASTAAARRSSPKRSKKR